MDIFLDFFFLFVFFVLNSELLLCQCQGHCWMLSEVAMLHILNLNCVSDSVSESENEMM